MCRELLIFTASLTLFSYWSPPVRLAAADDDLITECGRDTGGQHDYKTKRLVAYYSFAKEIHENQFDVLLMDPAGGSGHKERNLTQAMRRMTTRTPRPETRPARR